VPVVKKALYLTIPTLLLCALVALGYRVGQYTAAQQFEATIRGMEQGETLAAVLAVSPLNDTQRNGYGRAYSHATVDASAISWSVPNQPTPFVGTAPMPGQHHNAHINAWQMRSNQELRMPKPQGVYRIFLTGGSTAYGSGAPSQADTIGSLLQAQLNTKLSEKNGIQNNINYEVFTFANPAWASTQERIAIENYLSELQPDMVISLSGNNDVFWGDAGRNVLWFFSFADEYFKILANTGLQLAQRKALAELPQTMPTAERVPHATVAYRLVKNVHLGVQALQQIEQTGKAGVPWIFFLQPTLSVSRKKLTAREQDFLTDSKEYYIKCYQDIAKKLSALEKENFRFMNLSGVFDAYGAEEDMFLDQFHFGDKGNTVIANAMFTVLAPLVQEQ